MLLATLLAVSVAGPSLLPQLSPRSASGNLLLVGGRVHTGTNVDWPGPVNSFGGRLRNDDALDPAVDAVRIELPSDAFVMPGLQDAHGHLLGLGSLLAEVDLVGTTSFDQVVQRVAERAATQPAGSWVIGRGWDQNDWAETTMPHHRALSSVVPNHPVWLVRVDGHAGLANALALQRAGVTKASVVAGGGEILRDGDGEPTGVLVDAAMAAIPLPAPTQEQRRERLLAAQRECLRHGLTCVHDAGVDAATLQAMVELHRDGQWWLRTYVMLDPNERDLIARGPWQTPDGRITVRAVKAYADGALGSRGAALLEAYQDAPGKRGLVGMPKGSIQVLAQFCAEHEMQLCMHAIGDAANRAVLDAYAAVGKPGDRVARRLRFRIEHAQVLAEDDFARFAQLGVLPSMQPTHLTSDMPWAAQRLGPERTARAYAWTRFHRLGVIVPFGSDFPVESVDPRRGLFAAVTTRGVGGAPGPGFRPEQRLSREQAIRGFTLHAAHASFAERDLGTLEVGKVADLTVFDRDLRSCSDDDLLEAKVLLTVIGGQVVYDGRDR
ncbi:MAG: amidohydrolase [Planctomycetes bacterium]|nr:amidohydrolase [Planctomycetota bacterium]